MDNMHLLTYLASLRLINVTSHLFCNQLWPFLNIVIHNFH